MIRNLITYEEIGLLARPCTAEHELAESMIAEAQRLDIQPRLGDALYLRLAFVDNEPIIISGGDAATVGQTYISYDEYEAFEVNSENVDPYRTLLEGGLWVDYRGRRRLLSGVKTALAYYALARIMRDGNIQASTYGAVVKDDQYSQDPERNERQRQYRELFATADMLMSEIAEYLSNPATDIPEYCAASPHKATRNSIKIIGR